MGRKRPLSDIPSRTDSLVSDFKISIKEVSRLVHGLVLTKAAGTDQVPVVVLKTLSPEISPLLAKLFNRCVKENVFSILSFSICPDFNEMLLSISIQTNQPFQCHQ